MRMAKKKFRIGQLAKSLCLKEFVIRFWEKEFSLKPYRSKGKQRFYTDLDLEKFCLIKELLYKKKFTLNGAKLELNKTYLLGKKIIPSKKPLFEKKYIAQNINQDLAKQLIKLKKQLLNLKELL